MLEAENARMREVVNEIIDAYNISSDGYFCPNCEGTAIATYDEKCSVCGVDLRADVSGLIEKAKQALKGGE